MLYSNNCKMSYGQTAVIWQIALLWEYLLSLKCFRGVFVKGAKGLSGWRCPLFRRCESQWVQADGIEAEVLSQVFMDSNLPPPWSHRHQVTVLTLSSYTFNSTYLTLFYLPHCMLCQNRKSINHRVEESLGILFGLSPDSCENNTKSEFIFIVQVTCSMRIAYCYGGIIGHGVGHG